LFESASFSVASTEARKRRNQIILCKQESNTRGSESKRKEQKLYSSDKRKEIKIIFYKQKTIPDFGNFMKRV
jgi:hypothetical protein